MPYTIVKKGGKYCLKRRDGSIKSCHSTKGKAQASAYFAHYGEAAAKALRKTKKR